VNQPQHSQRIQFIADLRALADMFEQQPELPAPYNMTGVAYIKHQSIQVKVAAVFQLAQALGAAVTFDDQRGVCETGITLGRISYGVYAPIPKPTRTGGPAVVYDPTEVLHAIGIAPSPSEVLSTAKTALGEL
jgi:hypothetical protein